MTEVAGSGGGDDVDDDDDELATTNKVSRCRPLIDLFAPLAGGVR